VELSVNYHLKNMRLKMNTRTKIIASLFCLGAAGISLAAEFDDSARVLRVVEQTEQVNVPQQECRNETVQVQQQSQRPERGVGGAIIGGIAGGIIGNQVGGGKGRTAATAVGAVTGALVGDRVENNNNGNVGNGLITEQQVQRCRMVDRWETRINGYAVTYQYLGREYTTVLPRDPGENLHLRVSLTPRP
jgi:uncharacterized protein YcfJ